MYGLELVIIIVGTMLLLMSSNGERNSMAVGGWLITWRAIMGMFITTHHTSLREGLLITKRHWYRSGLPVERSK